MMKPIPDAEAPRRVDHRRSSSGDRHEQLGSFEV